MTAVRNPHMFLQIFGDLYLRGASSDARVRIVCMKINAFLVGLPMLAVTASAVEAAFTGWSVVASSGGGFDSYSVYANFNGATDRALNVFAFGSTTYIGTMNAVQDGMVVIGAGPWTPHQFETMADSYVTLGAWQTLVFTPTGIDLPIGAGWSNSAGAVNAQGGLVKVLQIARVSGDNTYFQASMRIGYNNGLPGSLTQFGDGSFAIPAPSVAALMLLTGLTGRTRRRS